MTGTGIDVESCLEAIELGHSGALPQIFDHFKPRLSQLIRLRMDPRLTARLESDDVLQEAYLDAEQQIHGYLKRRDVDFFVWLRGLTLQRLGKFHRFHLATQCRAIRRETALPDRSSLMLFRQLASPVATPSQQLQKRELHNRVQRAVDSLSANDKEVILMRHFESLSNRQMAQALGIKESTATMRYGRALARLRENLLNDSTMGTSAS